VATTALLLGGDEVTLDVSVGAGAWLEVVETAGTVAYPGVPATWHVRARLAPGAVLIWAGLPFVVCAGADVMRDTTLDLAEGARALLRETTVLGRVGEGPGVMRTRMTARLGGGELLAEDLVLDAAAVAAPGVLGGRRVIDTVAALGFRPDAGDDPAGRRRRLDLAGPGALARFVGSATHDSAVAADLAGWRAQAYGRALASATRTPAAGTASHRSANVPEVASGPSMSAPVGSRT
jgi:urease accessory protein